MTRRRSRQIGGAQATRQARGIGAEIRLARASLGMSEREVARRAGVSISTLRRIEDGDPGAQLNTSTAIGVAVGLDVVLKAYPGATPRLHDSGQLELAEQLCALAHPQWRSQLEVPAGDHGRSADLVFLGPDEILHMEIERGAGSMEAQYRSGVGKRDFLQSLHARPVRLVLVVEDTARNRAALAPHRQLIERQLPATSRQVLRALRDGVPLGTDGLLWVRRRPRARSIG